MSFDPNEHPRETSGQFAEKPQSAPETALAAAKPLTEDIATYLAEYDAASESYSESDGDGEDYEYWEDFQTDNSGRTYTLLQTAKAEIERLQAELTAAQQKHAVPEALREHIDRIFSTGDEPTLYVPEDGHYGEGYYDVIARVDGEATIKFTMNPDGSID
jgi:hypothetical protein